MNVSTTVDSQGIVEIWRTLTFSPLYASLGKTWRWHSLNSGLSLISPSSRLGPPLPIVKRWVERSIPHRTSLSVVSAHSRVSKQPRRLPPSIEQQIPWRRLSALTIDQADLPFSFLANVLQTHCPELESFTGRIFDDDCLHRVPPLNIHHNHLRELHLPWTNTPAPLSVLQRTTLPNLQALSYAHTRGLVGLEDLEGVFTAFFRRSSCNLKKLSVTFSQTTFSDRPVALPKLSVSPVLEILRTVPSSVEDLHIGSGEEIDTTLEALTMPPSEGKALCPRIRKLTVTVGYYLPSTGELLLRLLASRSEPAPDLTVATLQDFQMDVMNPWALDTAFVDQLQGVAQGLPGTRIRLNAWEGRSTPAGIDTAISMNTFPNPPWSY